MMTQEKRFNFIIQNLSYAIIKMIQENDGLSFLDATISFYSSKLYKKLSQETTKVWHLSACQLYDIYKDEKETGILDFDHQVAHENYQNDDVQRFCISVLEKYRTSHHMEGDDALNRFTQHNVFSFLSKNYRTLHTQSLENTCLDVDDYIRVREKKEEIQR